MLLTIVINDNTLMPYIICKGFVLENKRTQLNSWVNNELFIYLSINNNKKNKIKPFVRFRIFESSVPTIDKCVHFRMSFIVLMCEQTNNLWLNDLEKSKKAMESMVL